MLGSLTTCQPLWVILCYLPQKGRKETDEVVEEMKEGQGRKRYTTESVETGEKQNIPPLLLPAIRIAGLAKIMSNQSVNLLKLFQGRLRPLTITPVLCTHIFPVTEDCPSSISGRGTGITEWSRSISTKCYNEPSLRWQHLFPKTLPLKWICCGTEYLMSRLIRQKGLVLYLFPHRTCFLFFVRIASLRRF